MKKRLLVLHNNNGGNNHLVATRVADHFRCDVVSVDRNPSLGEYDVIILVLCNTGDEELPQPMEDFLFGLDVMNKDYCLCELGNYFGLETYRGCKKTAFRILDGLGWRKISDISLDSVPTLDWSGLEHWLRSLSFDRETVFVNGGGSHYLSAVKDQKPLPPFDRVYVFEPNPRFHESYAGSDFTLLKQAIWTRNCRLPFYLSRDDKQCASSLLEEKLCKVDSRLLPYWHDEPIEVECVDFSQWLRDHIEPHHDLTLKLDIEGAEYDVLAKMIEDGTIGLVKRLYVEFHQATVKSKAAVHDGLVSALRERGIEPIPWD